MKKSILIIGTALLALPMTLAAQTVVEGFENSSEWVVSGNDISSNGASATTADTTGVTDTATEVTYNFSGNQYYEVKIEKTLGAPIDLSDALELQLDVRGHASAADLGWYVRLIDVDNKCVRMVNLGDAFSTDGSWKRYAFSLAELDWNLWISSTNNPPNLTQISTIQVNIQQKSGIAAAGTAVVAFDNLTFKSTSDRMDTTVIDNFDYADQTALEGAWNTAITSGGTQALALDSSDVVDGSGAMAMTVDMNKVDSRNGYVLPLASATDYSAFDAFRISVKGDSTMPAAGDAVYRQLLVSFEDTAVNRGRWFLRLGYDNPEYNTYVLFPTYGQSDQMAAQPTVPFLDDAWDRGAGVVDDAQLDMTVISKLMLYFEDGASASSSYPDIDSGSEYSATFKFDRFEGFTLKDTVDGHEIPIVEPALDASNWVLYR